MSKYSYDERIEISEWIEDKLHLKDCPICRIPYLHVHEDDVVIGDTIYIKLLCFQCGYTMLFDSVAFDEHKKHAADE